MNSSGDQRTIIQGPSSPEPPSASSPLIEEQPPQILQAEGVSPPRVHTSESNLVNLAPTREPQHQYFRVKIHSEISSYRSQEAFLACSSQTVGSLLREFLRHSHINATRTGKVYNLRNEDNLILSKRRKLSKLDIHEDDTLYLVVQDAKFLDRWYDSLPIIAGAFILMLIVASFLVAISAFFVPHGDTLESVRAKVLAAQRYGVVFDAGSVHTTVNVYKWPNVKLNGTGVVSEAFSCEGDAAQGVSSFENNPKGVQSYILDSDCYKKATEKVPSEQRANTSIFLGATAGMRVLNATSPDAASKIIGNISQALATTPFDHSKQTAKIMTGADEGMLGWVTSNYLSNTFATDPKRNAPSLPLGALDWGGASSQITFVTTDDKFPQDLRKVKLYGKEYNLFTKSHLCYGQSEALSRYLVHIVHNAFTKNKGKLSHEKLTFDSPCHPKLPNNYNVTAGDLFYSPCTIYEDDSFQNVVESIPKNQNISFIGIGEDVSCDNMILLSSFNHRNCMDTYKAPNCFNSHDLPTPHPAYGMEFLAFSTYWYVLDAMRTSTKLLGKTDGLGEHHLIQSRAFNKDVKDLCTSESAQQSLSSFTPDVQFNTCFRGLFMNRLLTDGYKFNEAWDRIKFVKRVHDADVGWTLGHMILASNDVPELTMLGMRGGDDRSPVHLVEVGLFVLIFCFFICFVWVVSEMCSSDSRSFLRERFVGCWRRMTGKPQMGQQNV